jgi:hypothetical protein
MLAFHSHIFNILKHSFTSSSSKINTMTGTTGAMNGSAKKGGIAKAKKFDFKPVNHAEFAEKGMNIYRAPSLLQPHRVSSWNPFSKRFGLNISHRLVRLSSMLTRAEFPP